MSTINFELVSQDVENQNFDCGIDSINKYVRESYYPLLVQHAYTFSIVYNTIILGYIQILFRDVTLDYFPENISDYDPEIKNSTLSALHIRFIAIDKQYQKKNIGTVAMNVMIKRAEDLALQWPIRLITIDARKELVEWYKKIGFHEMMINSPGQDGVTVAMYYDCMKYSEQLSRYCSENV